MLCWVAFINKINLFLVFSGRVTACPPGPGATQRSSTAGVVSDQDELHQSGSHGEDVTQSPPAPGQRGQSEVETEVVMRSQWQQRAPAGQQGQGVISLRPIALLVANDRARCMEISARKEQVQWRSHCRSSGELGMLAASGRRQASRFRWPNLTTAVPLQN